MRTNPHQKEKGIMTDQEMNKLVAIECGWREVKVFEWSDDGKTRIPKQFHESCDDQSELPPFTYCLNACALMEESLTAEEEEEYVERLSAEIMSGAYDDAMLDRWHKSNLASSDSTYRATPRQRVEAFLKTKGKWKKGKWKSATVQKEGE